MSWLISLVHAFGMKPVEWIAVFFGIISVYLSVKEKIWSWPTGIINVTLYIFIFYDQRLYADMGLQVFYVVISFYGWWNWLYGGQNHSELHVTRLSWRGAVLASLGFVAGTVALALFLRHTNDVAPWTDALLTVASLIAQYLMTKKVLENWAIWIAADVGYVALYIYRDLYPTAFLYAVFLLLATMGHLEWKKSLAPAPVAA